jgi:hypothetical protein
MPTKEACDKCPLAAVDQRLDDAHRIWHRADLTYFDPEEFRINAQHLIQTLRTVSFVLQNHKRDIPDFDTWYAAWQDRLRSDLLMRWLVEARNKIEKQGDLESKSYVRAEVIASYFDEGPRIEIEAQLFQGPKDLLRGIPKRALQRQVLRHGALRIERRWVENSLPEHELLEALAIAFAKLRELVADAHRQMGLPEPKTIEHETGRKIDVKELEGRLPCMIAHSESRDLVLSLRTGKQLAFKRESKLLDHKSAKEVAERYGKDIGLLSPPDFESVPELANWYFEQARHVFMKDGYHQWITFFLKGTKIVWLAATPTADRQEKYLMMRHLANEARRRSADGVMMINEVWIAQANSLAPFQYPNEIPNRMEALSLSIAAKDGTFFQLSAMITREGQRVYLGETMKQDTGTPYLYAPFYEVWGRGGQLTK